MTDLSDDSGATELRSAVRKYAAHLLERLSQIGIITHTSEPMPRALYQTPTLHKHDPHADADKPRNRGTRSESSSDARRPMPSIDSHRDLFDAFRDAPNSASLLIIAPAGYGKSCILESLALHMVHDLLDDAVWPVTAGLPPAVPLVISLARMQEARLSDYLLLPEAQLSTEPLLEPRLLLDLLERRRLILLIDGFDEVPEIQNSLARDLKLSNWCFVLTSRPGHGAERLIDNHARRYTIEALSKQQSHNYVNAYFLQRHLTGVNLERVLSAHESAWCGHLGYMLRLPLYLKAWCDYVEDSAGRQIPTSLNELSDFMVRRLLTWRQLLRIRFPTQVAQVIEAFGNWLGQLGLEFAARSFAGQHASFLLSTHLIGEGVSAINIDGHQFDLLTMACQAGLVVYRPTTDMFYLPQVPLLESLIGKALANDAYRNPSMPNILITTFRRMVWLPRHTEVIDYLFARLITMPNGERSPWANELLQWVENVVHYVDAEESGANERVADDLLHPFALALVRWRLLDARGHRNQGAANVQALATAVVRAAEGAFDLDEMLDDFESIAGILCNEFCRQLSLRMVGEAGSTRICKALMFVAGHVGGDEVPELVRRLVKLIDDGWLNEQHLFRAAWRASERLNTRDAAALLWEWGDECERASSRPDVQRAWIAPMAMAAGRVSPGKACAAARAVIRKYDNARDDPLLQQAWLIACVWISLADGFLPTVALVREMLEQHRRVGANNDAQKRWRSSITSCCARLGQDGAPAIFPEILNECIQAPERDAQREWGVAVADLHKVIRPEMTLATLRQLIDAYDHCAKDGKKHDGLLQAIHGGPRFGPENAPRIVRGWIDDEIQLRGEAACREAWNTAIAKVSSEIEMDSAADVIREWIGRHNAAKSNNAVQEAWQIAIHVVSRQMAPPDAASIAAMMIEEHGHARAGGASHSGWLIAIGNAARQIPEGAAGKYILEWIDRHDYGLASAAVREALRAAVRSAIAAVGPDAADECIYRILASHDSAQHDVQARQEWMDVLARLLSRAPCDCIDGRVSMLFERYGAAVKNGTEQNEWQSAILASASRVSVSAVPALIRRLMDMYEQERDSVQANGRWIEAMRNAVSRINPELVLDLVRRWIEEYRRSVGNVEMARLWIRAVGSAAWAAHGKNACEMIRLFIEEYDASRDNSECRREWSTLR